MNKIRKDQNGERFMYVTIRIITENEILRKALIRIELKKTFKKLKRDISGEYSVKNISKSIKNPKLRQ